jgi:GntR family transcriptional regulator, rspAB operon transcriptional repressor
MLLRDNLYDAIRSEILSCRLAPGEAVREQEFAARFQVSRQPVREALLRLEQERLITVHPRQGYQVSPISVRDARDLFRFRQALEPACVAEAIESAPDKLMGALDRFRTLEPGQDFIAYNRAFHHALADASGNARMSAVACDLVDQADRLVRISLGSIKGRDPTLLVAEHGELIDAMQRRAARAARKLIRAHVASAERRVLSALSRSAVQA